MEVGSPKTPALAPALSSRRGRNLRNDEASSDHGSSTASGVLSLFSMAADYVEAAGLGKLKVALPSEPPTVIWLKIALAAPFIDPVTGVQHQVLPAPLDGGAWGRRVRNFVHLATAPTEGFVERLESFLPTQP